ncbi:MAG: efflux RND transporter periplasmic adaptor subunit [Balneolales bacterium]
MNFRKSKKLILAGFVIVSLLAIIVFARSGDEAAEVTEETTESSVPVRTTIAETDHITQTNSYAGSIEEWEYAYVTATSGSRIERILVEEGESVENGQLLVEMESTGLRQAEIQLNSARRERDRLADLVEIGAVTRQQLDQAESELDNALSNYEQVRENTSLKAPIDGIVTEKYFVDGESFTAGAERPSIVTLMKTDPVKVVVSISEQYYPMIERGLPVDITLDTYGNRIFEGEVNYVASTVNSESRTFEVEIRIDNPDGVLRPGMFARVSVNIDEAEGLFLPASAVMRQADGRRYVYILDDEAVQRVPVVVGPRFEERLMILDGIEAGAEVITEGSARINNGSKVRVVTQ